MTPAEQTEALKELLRRMGDVERRMAEEVGPELDSLDDRLDNMDGKFAEVTSLLQRLEAAQKRSQFDPLLLESATKKVDAMLRLLEEHHKRLMAHIEWEEGGRG